MLTLTEPAQDVVAKLLSQKGLVGGGLSITVQTGGCAGFQYGMALRDVAKDDEIVVEQGAVKLFVDPEAASLLEGTTIDFVESIESSGFYFNNPNAEGKCGCGKSFSA